MADRAQVDEVAARVLDRHPAIELLVNNAGVPARGSFLDIDPERIERVIDVNYLGGVWCLRAFRPGLQEAAATARRHVVNLVSVSGTVTFAPAGAYAAAKHAQLAFSRSTAALLRSSGIRVHTVLPGYVETEGFPQRTKLRSPFLRRFVIEADDVASAVVGAVEKSKGEVTVPWFPYRPSRSRRRSCPGSWRGSPPARPPTTTSEPRLGARLAGDVPADLDLVGRRGRRAADLRPLLLGHAGEVEPLLEVDLLACHLGGQQHEVVRVEVSADVAVGQEALVRRVAQPLEPVHLQAPQRVDRAELIGDEDASPEPGHAGELRHGELGTADVVEDPDAGRDVELA